MSLQVLVATMNQSDLSLYQKMNLQCDAVFANQAETESFLEYESEIGRVQMITTKTRGVGLNRNIALHAATAEYLLFADDDVVYYDGMKERVLQAFRDLPEADIIFFGMDMEQNGKIFERRNCKTERVRLWKAMKYGTYRIAARRSSLVRENITFHQMFGGGCIFSAGEDSLFIKKCFDQGLKLYSYNYVLGRCAKDTSSWFCGYGEKYFYDKGVLVRRLFPRLFPIMGLYFAIRFKRETKLSPIRRICLVYRGIRGGKTMKPYQE